MSRKLKKKIIESRESSMIALHRSEQVKHAGDQQEKCPWSLQRGDLPPELLLREVTAMRNVL